METIQELIRYKIHFLETHKGKLIVDADTHITDIHKMHSSLKLRLDKEANYYHGRPISAEDLLKEMDMAGVDMSLIWQNPAATFYPGPLSENYAALYQANQYIYETANKYPDKFIPAGWTDPKALGTEKALDMIETCVREFGFPIVKINPAQNQFPIDSEQVVTLVKKIVQLGAIPAFHFGADTPFTPPEGLENLADIFPESPIIAIHMGGGGAGYVEAEDHYHKARLIGLKYPNIKYILSAKRDTHIESDLITYQLNGNPFKQNICCASDAPYGRQTWNFGGYDLMFKSLLNGKNHTDVRLYNASDTFTEADVKNYLGGNIIQVALDGYRQILKLVK